MNSLEEYHLIQAGPDGTILSNRIVGRENNPHREFVNAITPSSIDWKSKGAGATQETMIAFLKWQRHQGATRMCNREASPVNESRSGVDKAPVTPNQVAEKPAQGPPNEPQKNNIKKKSGGGQGFSPGNETGGGKPKLTLEDLAKSLGTVLREINTLKNSVQAGTKGRACNSVCYRCQKKGHFARDCSNPMPNGIMCLTGASYCCSGGGAHACECGSCHWADGINTDSQLN